MVGIAIATAILFAIFKKTWIVAIGAGFIYCSIGSEFFDSFDDSLNVLATVTVIGCIIAAIAKVVLGSTPEGIIFYILASIENAVLCAGMSSTLAARGFDRLYKSSYIRDEDDAKLFILKRKMMGEDNIFFMIINIAIYGVLAVLGLFVPFLAFSPLLYLVLRIIYLKIRLR